MDVQARIGVSGAGDRGQQANLFGDEGPRHQGATYRLLGQGQRVVEESPHPLGGTPTAYILVHGAGRQMTGAHLGAAPHALRYAVMTDTVRVIVPPQLDLVVCRRRGLAEGDDACGPGQRGQCRLAGTARRFRRRLTWARPYCWRTAARHLCSALLSISASIDWEKPSAEPGVAATLQSATLVSVAAGFRARRREVEPPHIRVVETSTPPSPSDAEKGNHRLKLLVSVPARRLTRLQVGQQTQQSNATRGGRGSPDNRLNRSMPDTIDKTGSLPVVWKGCSRPRRLTCEALDPEVEP